MMTIVLELDETTAELLQQVCGDSPSATASNVNELVEMLALRAADGVRRPGSWERGWLTQCTGWPDWQP